MLERLTTLFPYDSSTSQSSVELASPVCTGPYQLDDFDRDLGVTFSANPNYWKAGEPRIKTLEVRFLPDAEQRVQALLDGEIDVAMNLRPEQWDLLYKTEGVEPDDIPVLRIFFWQFDSIGRASKTPLMDVRVRRAIWHAIDLRSILSTAFNSRAGLLETPVNPRQFGYDPTVHGLRYNPDRSRQLLTEAGYPEGLSIDLWQYTDEQDTFNRAALPYLEAVGIRVRLHDYRGRLGEMKELRKRDAVIGILSNSWGSYNIFDADGILPYFFSNDSKRNYSGDDEVSEMLKMARNTVGFEQRKDLYSKSIKRINDQAYWMPNFIAHRIWGRRTGLNLVVGRDEVARYSTAYWE